MNILINRSSTKDRRLDCVPEYDERSLLFLTRNLLEAEAQIEDKSWPLDVQLDQGNEGACVGFGFSHELAAEPTPVAGVTDSFAKLLYRRAQQLDEWPGEKYEGTSVLAGAKACQEIGDIVAYFWAKSAEEIAKALSHIGPVVIGVNWYEGMENVDETGYVWPTGSVRGGHCVVLIEVRAISCPDGSLFEVVGQNSWGSKWGDHGRFTLTGKSLAKLMADAGSAACVPTGREDTGKWPEPRKRRLFDFLRRNIA